MTTRTFNQPDTYVPAGYLPTVAGSCDVIESPQYPTASNLASVTRGAKSGSSTPNYHQLLKSGALLPLNGYRRWDYRFVANPGSYTIYGLQRQCGGTWYPVVITYQGLVVPPLLWDPGDEVLDLSEISLNYEAENYDSLIIAAMADMLPDLDALTTALEARQTMDMVVGARNDAKRLIRQALRGGYYTAKAAADAWLAWRYGWEQLGRDVSNVYDLLQKPIQSLVVEGRAGESFSESESVEHPYVWGTSNGRYAYDVDSDVSVRANAVGMLRGETLNFIANPLTSAWEVVPYSFVADWFVNVGDVLAAWQVKLSMQRLYLSLGHKVNITVNGKFVVDGPGSNPTTTASGSSSSVERYELKTRVPTSSPSLVPSFNVRLTGKRVLDAAALLAKRIL